MPDYCLFTGEELRPDNLEEHTILRSLGGRIKSTRVSSSSFNNATSKFDDILLGPYRILFKYLSPLLSSEHKSGQVDVSHPEQKGPYVLETDGSVRMKGVIVERDANGVPNAILGQDEDRLIRMRDQLGWKNFKKVLVPNKTFEYENKPSLGIAWEIDLAALKCILLSFDHLLYDAPERFTRTSELFEVRSLVRDAIVTGSFDFHRMKPFLLGIDYAVVPAILEFRRAVLGPESEFEHVLVVSGDATYQTLDACWLIAGFDPVRFRLTDKWVGKTFTAIAVNGVLRDSRVIPPKIVRERLSLGIPNPFRSVTEINVNADEMQRVGDDVALRRLEATRRAIFLVEMNDDATFLQFLKVNAAKLQARQGLTNIPVLEAIGERLRHHYLDRVGNDLTKIREIVDGVRSNLPEYLLEQTLISGDQKLHCDLGPWLPFYREALTRMAGLYGMPGAIAPIHSTLIRE